jgi:hypothetical protein
LNVLNDLNLHHQKYAFNTYCCSMRWVFGEPLPVAPRVRLDHGALVSLLVPSPTVPVVAAIRAILKVHNPIEEDRGGMYDQCEELAGAQVDQILRRLRNFPEVKVLPHVDSAFVMEATRRALARAGYDLEV